MTEAIMLGRSINLPSVNFFSTISGISIFQHFKVLLSSEYSLFVEYSNSILIKKCTGDTLASDFKATKTAVINA